MSPSRILAAVALVLCLVAGAALYVTQRSGTDLELASTQAVPPTDQTTPPPASSAVPSSAATTPASPTAKKSSSPIVSPPASTRGRVRPDSGASSPAQASAARRVIFDTDFYTDVDDVVAARLLARADRAGKVDLLAAVLSTRDERSAQSLDAFLRHEGLSVPIGVVPENYDDHTSGSGSYHDALRRLPRKVQDASKLPRSTALLRSVLKKAPDKSVDYIAVGFLGPLHALMESPGDSTDSRTGAQLIRAKVRHLWVMGGKYPSGGEYNFNKTSKARAASHAVMSNWPGDVPLTLLGYEVGHGVLSGGILNQDDRYKNDPLARALRDHGSAHGRHSWDPMLVQLAVSRTSLEANGYSAVRGRVSVNRDGYSSWQESATGPHRYVVRTKPQSWYAQRLDAQLVP